MSKYPIKDMDKAMEEIQSAIDIQCSDGNWNYSEYMMGMANGMIFVKSCLTGEEPEYLDGPEVWGKDKPRGGDVLATEGETNEVD